MLKQLSSSTRELEAVCRRYHVRRLDVFGSASRSSEGPVNDVDLLVEFDHALPDTRLATYLGLAESLEALWQIPVDLLTTRSVKNPYLRASIEKDRESLYLRED